MRALLLAVLNLLAVLRELLKQLLRYLVPISSLTLTLDYSGCLRDFPQCSAIQIHGYYLQTAPPPLQSLNVRSTVKFINLRFLSNVQKSKGKVVHPQGKFPWYSLDSRLGGSQSCSGRDGEEKNSQPPPGIEL
jgi:hypothetical protein